ncbi:MAG: hypothetical protein JXR96_26480 [Deltaproteobacteria bacterium]|nr:hypothetical protein [Deltaproteobacteria bacterium]
MRPLALCLSVAGLVWLAACAQPRPVPAPPAEMQDLGVGFECSIQAGCLHSTRSISLEGRASLTLQGDAASLALAYRRSETLSPARSEPGDRGPVRHYPPVPLAHVWYGVAERSGHAIRIDLLPVSRYCPPREGLPTPACHGDRTLVEEAVQRCRIMARAGAPLHLTRGCRPISLRCAWETLDVAAGERRPALHPERILVCETESRLPFLLSRIPFSPAEGLRLKSFNPSSLPSERFELFRAEARPGG